MPNAKDATASENQSILAVGDIGVGKTTQLLTLPGKKFIYLFDPNALNSLVGHDVEYEDFIVDSMDLDIAVKTLKKDVADRSKIRKKIEPKTYITWEEDFEKKLESGFFKQYDWVGFDSLTTFSDIVMDRVQYLSGRLGKHPEQGDWTAQMSTIRNVFRALMGSGCNIYAPAHHELKQDDLSSKVHNQLLLTGKLRTQIPLLFSQVLVYSTSKSSKDGIRYTMQTRPDRENPKVRCTFKDVSPVEDVTLDLAKPLEGQGVGQFITN